MVLARIQSDGPDHPAALPCVKAQRPHHRLEAHGGLGLDGRPDHGSQLDAQYERACSFFKMSLAIDSSPMICAR